MTPEYAEAHAVYEEDREDFLLTWNGVYSPFYHWDDDHIAQQYRAEVQKLTDGDWPSFSSGSHSSYLYSEPCATRNV